MWKPHLLMPVFWLFTLLSLLSVNMIAGVTSTWESPPWWEEGCALSSRRDRRHHAVWETAWKSASVNTPRPHVLPGQGGLAALQPHLHTIPQLLASRAKEGEQSSQTERTCLLCDGSVSDESGDIVGKQWEDACSARIKRTLVLYPKIILWMPYLQMYICITAPDSHAEICLTKIIALTEEGLLYIHQGPDCYTATLCMCCFIALVGHTMPVFLHILLTHCFSNRRAHIMTLCTPICVWHFP